MICYDSIVIEYTEGTTPLPGYDQRESIKTFKKHLNKLVGAALDAGLHVKIKNDVNVIHVTLGKEPF